MGSHDDSLDALRYALAAHAGRVPYPNRYVAFEEVGRPKRYTYVDELPSLRPEFELTDLTDRVFEATERRSFDILIDEAAHEFEHSDGRIIDTLRDAEESIRNAGYGGETESTPCRKVSKGAVWLTSKAVRDALADTLFDPPTTDGIGIDGYDVLVSPEAPDDTIVLVDTRVVSEPPVVSIAVPFVVIDPKGIAVVRVV